MVTDSECSSYNKLIGLPNRNVRRSFMLTREPLTIR
jgi:hypothetical protein